jgi:ATP-dependent DNA helicase UvrD/PcrA
MLSADELLLKLEKVTEKRYSDDQRTAILHGTGPLWITAGPGSGKSEVLVARTLKLMISDRVPPASIVLTTFTEKAADNLSNRMASYLQDLGLADSVDITDLRSGTLHGLCNSIMREHRFPKYLDLELLDENSHLFFLYNQEDITNFFKKHWKDFAQVFSGFPFSRKYGPNRWQTTGAAGFMFDRITEFRVDVDLMRKSSNKVVKGLADAYDLYQQRLRDYYRCDFSTLQKYFLSFLDSPHGAEFLNGDPGRQQPPVRDVLVDEFQDTNPIQEDIYFRMALTKPHNLAVVGDDDQALYRFRGGTVDSLVNFGDRCVKEWKLTPQRANLHENRRSHSDIVTWFNGYVFGSPPMNKPKVRAPNKRKMVAKSKVKGGYPPVCAILGDDFNDAAKILAGFLGGLKKRGLVTNWEEVAILLRSTKESPWNAGPFVEALAGKGIPYYNPRNRGLHEDPVIQQLLGALVVTLDEDLETLKAVKGRVANEVRSWIRAYEGLSKTAAGKTLAKYVEKSHGIIKHLEIKTLLNTTVMDVLYRILSLPPFRNLKEDPNYATRFALVTDLIDSFTAFTEGYGLLRTSSTEGGRLSFKFLMKLYYEFSGFIQTQGLNDPENPEDLIPKGFVQIMTVHQAKGLQFPIVIVGSLRDRPEVSGDNWTEDFLAPFSVRKPNGTALERAQQDLIRRFYVAFSRAQDLLILCGKKGVVSSWALEGSDGD